MGEGGRGRRGHTRTTRARFAKWPLPSLACSVDAQGWASPSSVCSPRSPPSLPRPLPIPPIVTTYSDRRANVRLPVRCHLAQWTRKSYAWPSPIGLRRAPPPYLFICLRSRADPPPALPPHSLLWRAQPRQPPQVPCLEWRWLNHQGRCLWWRRRQAQVRVAG